VDITGIDHDITIHVDSTAINPDQNVVRTTVCGSSYGACTTQSMSFTNSSATAGARCCSDVEKSGWSKDNSCAVWAESFIDEVCPGNITFDDASELCDAQGARLCTKSELVEQDCAAGTGCELDHSMVWSSSDTF
jgi:hypothetical protein